MVVIDGQGGARGALQWERKGNDLWKQEILQGRDCNYQGINSPSDSSQLTR